MLEQVALPDVLLEPVQRDLWHVWTGVLHISYASQTCQVSQLHCSTAPLLHSSTASLLHNEIPVLSYYFITPLLNFSVVHFSS